MNQPPKTSALRSDLARLCLPADGSAERRGLAWVNSVCALVLVIGATGAGPAVVVKHAFAPAPDVLPAVIEQVAPPLAAVEKLLPSDAVATPAPEAAEVVVVTPPSPEILFSVPTLGSLVVPAALAVAPPLRPLEPPKEVVRAAPFEPAAPVSIDATGLGGERPHPPYPRLAIERHQQGAVVLELVVDRAGEFREVRLKSSSGSEVLDRSTVDYVRKHWKIPAGPGDRLYEATIRYVLEAD